MALTRLEILSRAPYAGGRAFGDAGSYEHIEALAHYAVDPAHPANRGIVDLELAGRGDDGLVHFRGDATFLLPTDPARANRAALVEVPNRGHRIAMRTLNHAPVTIEATDRLDPGDGYLFRHGWVVAWCGWQWDVPRSAERIGLEAPQVPREARARANRASRVQLRIQPSAPSPTLALTDQHVGALGNHLPVRAADVEDPDATLTVRDSAYADAQIVPRSRWRFARLAGGGPVPDDAHIWLDGGFAAGRVYDVVYEPRDCPVVGAGLLAVRDFGAFLRAGRDGPAAGLVDHVIAEGQSQCGRFLRTFLYLGLNLDEADTPVFDGVLAHIAGGRRGEFNHRHAQPSVQPTPSFGHLFPFADEPQRDPHSGQRAGLLDRQRTRGGLPRVFYTDTASEYWRGDAGLTHLALGDHGDAEPPPEVRRYLFASTQHGAGLVPFTDRSIFGSRGANLFNAIDYRPLYRAALANLLAWIADGIEPPVSCFPRVADGTAAERPAVLEALGRLPGLALPDQSLLPRVYPLDLGPGASQGVGTFPARVAGPPYPDRVSAVDADGNETGGIRMPDLAVPVATHTGFNPRHPGTGGEGQLLEYIGAALPFPVTEAERRRRGDPRRSVESRYPSREDYLARVRAAAAELVQNRYLLSEDIDLCVAIAAERYDACLARQPAAAD